MMNTSLRNMVFAALFAALIIVGSYLSLPVPFSPVPLVLADFFVILAGLALGPSWGTFGIGMFLLMGFLGIPVFAGGKAGVAVFAGTTGGYLVGYLTGGALAGYLSHQRRFSVIKDILGIILGYLLIFGFGTVWLAWGIKLGWEKALMVGILPYIPGTVLKAVVMGFVIKPLRKLMTESI